MGVQLDIDVFEFKLLETHELETNADIENKAQNDAAAGLPSAELNSLCETAQEAETEALNHIGEETQRARAWSQDIASIISNNRQQFSLNPFSRIEGEMRAQLNADFAGAESDFATLRDEVSRTENNLRTFKLEHKLKRDPVVRPYWIKIVTYLVPLVFIVFETYYNGQVFADNMQGGAVAGQMMALGISLVNVLTSFFIGMMLPWLWFKEITYRIWGSVFVILWLALITFVNFLFGVYRSLIEIANNSEEVSSSWGEAFIQVGNPFTQLGVLEQNGIQFITVCFIFAFASLLDGLFKNDTYKGYGSLGEKVNKAKSNLEDKRNELTEKLLSVRTYFSNEVTKEFDSDIESIQLWRSSVETLQLFKSSFDSFIRDVSSKLDHAIQEYYSKNDEYRNQNLHGRSAYYDLIRSPEFETHLNPDNYSFANTFPFLQGEYFEDDAANEIKAEATRTLEANRDSVLRRVQEIYEEYSNQRDGLIQ